MTEAALQQAVIDLARWCGYLHWHDNDSRRNLRGFPDLVLIHRTNGRLIFAELKSEKGRIRPEQQVWLETLGIHHESYLWRPRHWQDGTIRRVLTAETRRAVA
jgi:hypothetical protein